MSPPSVLRSRSLSESVSSHSGRSAPAVSKPLMPIDFGPAPPRKKETQPSSLGGVAGKSSLSKHRSATSSHDSTAQATSNSISLQEDVGNAHSGKEGEDLAAAARSKGLFEALKMHESEGDFARHVRGTSTPIEVSQSQSYSDNSGLQRQREEGEGGAVGGVASDVSVSVIQSYSDNTLQDGEEGGAVGGVAYLTSEEILQHRGEAVAAAEYVDDGGVATTELDDEDIDESVAERATLKRADAMESEESREGGGLCETS